MICQKCGAEVENNTKFCPACGAEVSSEPETKNQTLSLLDNLNSPTIQEIWTKSFNFLKQKPLLLWGLSLLNSLLSWLAVWVCLLPIISIPVITVLNTGMAVIYLNGYRGNEINAGQLFAGFKSFLHVAGGMLWMALWVFIWALIPIVGIVFAIIKIYSYRFVPYILTFEPEISATEALRKSMKMTDGYRGRMFGADFLFCLCLCAIILVLAILTLIPFVGILFGALAGIAYIIVGMFLPLILGIFQAAFYDEILKKNS